MHALPAACVSGPYLDRVYICLCVISSSSLQRIMVSLLSQFLTDRCDTAFLDSFVHQSLWSSFDSGWNDFTSFSVCGLVLLCIAGAASKSSEGLLGVQLSARNGWSRLHVACALYFFSNSHPFNEHFKEIPRSNLNNVCVCEFFWLCSWIFFLLLFFLKGKIKSWQSHED